MTDQQLLERRVRETLTTRADGVAATPALYKRVQRGIRRDRRWGLARAWAMLATIVVLAGLVIVALPADEVGVDVVEEPSDTTREDGDGSTEDADGGVDTAPVSDLPFGGVGYVQLDADGRLTVYAPDGSSRFSAATVRVDEAGTRDVVPAVDLAAPANWSVDDGVLVALHEGATGAMEIQVFGPAAMDGGPTPTARFTGLDEIAPDGGRIAMLPDGRAVVWIQDRTLGVLPLTPDGGVQVATARYTPLELPSDGPDRLVAQQVVEHDDGSFTLFATDPDGRQAWSLPLVTAAPGEITPAGPSLPEPGDDLPAATVLAGPVPGLGAVLDVVSLPDGSMLSLEAPTDVSDVPVLRRTTFGPPGEDRVQPMADLLWSDLGGGFELDSGGGWQVTLGDGQRAIVHRYLVDPDASGDESLVTSRGADAAIAGVHVGADPAAWDGAGDAAGGWRDELEAAHEEALREQLAQARAAADALRARIAALEDQQEQATDAVEAQALEQQLVDLRSQLERQANMIGALESDLAVRRLEERARQDAEQ